MGRGRRSSGRSRRSEGHDDPVDMEADMDGSGGEHSPGEDKRKRAKSLPGDDNVEPAAKSHSKKTKRSSMPVQVNGAGREVERGHTPNKKTSRKAGANNVVDDISAVLSEFDARQKLRDVIEQKDEVIASLKAQYESLKASKVSQLDKALQRVREEMSGLDEGTAPVIAHLESQIETLKETIHHHEQQKHENELLKNETVALHSKVRKLERALESKEEASVDPNSERIIETYQVLTGTRVTLSEPSEGMEEDDESVSRFVCKSVDRRLKRVIEFALEMNEDGQVKYLPNRIEFRGGVVPDYLEDEIEFDIMETPRFVKNLLAALQNDATAPEDLD